eukprot:m.1086734 g.1086734  ORF g.1086734 m.1086734 type:complete len:366 (+) comp24280_c0_seq21:135-1232(+)
MSVFVAVVAYVAHLFFNSIVASNGVDVYGFEVPAFIVSGFLGLAFAVILQHALAGRRQPVEGAVFITGCDSGMGEVSALHLAKIGFRVYAGCFLQSSDAQLQEKFNKQSNNKGSISYVPLDVTKTESIQQAHATVEKDLAANGMNGLVSIINCAGISYTGPLEYLPMRMYRHQMDVNFFGYIEVTKAFLPLVKRVVSDPQQRRGRVVFVGTGGGVLTPAPGLLSAYMASKWAGEAFIQCLRMEMRLTGQRIDACMVNPGFIKPTGLVDAGKANVEKMWTTVPANAREEYEWLTDRFIKFSDDQPGTHPRFIAYAMEEALTASRPNLSYKVGPDSKASPFVGMLPTKLREWIVNASMFQVYDWTPQ